LPQNFNQPYAAVSIADFWRRWHISFSNWLRDYLYFSFPGKRSKIMPYFSLFLTMVIGGLWHGASWNFVIWGALHGLGLVIVRGWQTRTGTAPATGIWRYVSIFVTFQFVTFAWIFFRAPNLETVNEILHRIGSLSVSAANLSGALALILTIAVLGHSIPKKWYDYSVGLYVKAPFYAQAAAMALMVTGLQYLAQTGATPFIYNKF
jgi:D-alanyl-lipoteichoic acid acyltransferase DltB (MBOAT superfamily)